MDIRSDCRACFWGELSASHVTLAVSIYSMLSVTGHVHILDQSSLDVHAKDLHCCVMPDKKLSRWLSHCAGHHGSKCLFCIKGG